MISPSRRLPRRALLGVLAVALPGLPLTATGHDPAAPAADLPAHVLAAATGELGHDRIGVRRADTWYLRDALDGGPSRGYREDVAGWAPVAGDFDGDGAGSVGLFSAGTFRLRDRERGPVRLVRFGGRGDLPVVGDFDGDGVDTVGVFRSGRWYLRASNSSAAAPSRAFSYGRAGDVPVVGDWDADGDDDIGVRRGGTWFQRDAASAGPSSRSFSYGRPGDLPVVGDWDHDGRDTPGVFRAGTWYLRRGSFESPSQVVHLGSAGDRPVVRRTRGLAPGVRHTVLRDPAAPWVAHVATVELAATSSPDPVLAQDRLRGTEVLSSMVRRTGAVLGVNGDFFLPDGRPLHLHAEDGRLLQTDVLPGGRALSLDATGNRTAVGTPDVRTTVTVRPGEPTAASSVVQRVNAGIATSGLLAAYTREGAGLESPLDEQCYTLLKPAGAPAARPDGTVETRSRAGTPRCGGPRPALPATGTLLAAEQTGPAGAFLRALPVDSPVATTTQLASPFGWDAVGGGPLLVADGAVLSREVDHPDAFFGLHPRTAVGTTADGRLLLVVVEGRQPGYSRGMTMRQLAELMQRLGARSAMNLDGGGSTEMVVNGVVATRPSDGAERPVSNGLVVLPGVDRAAAPTAPAAPLAPRLRGPADTDGASTGGLADALVRSGAPVPPALRRSAQLFRSAADRGQPQG